MNTELKRTFHRRRLYCRPCKQSIALARRQDFGSIDRFFSRNELAAGAKYLIKPLGLYRMPASSALSEDESEVSICWICSRNILMGLKEPKLRLPEQGWIDPRCEHLMNLPQGKLGTRGTESGYEADTKSDAK